MNTTVDLYPKELYQKLEFDKILSLLSGKCLSPLGKAEVEKIQILTDTNEIQKRLLQTNELKQLLFNEEQPFPIEYYFDLNEELKLIQIENAVLNEQQAFRVYKACVGIMALMHYFGKEGSEKREKYPNLAQLLKNVEVPNHLLNDFKNILTDEGRVRNDASPGLISIRKNMNACYQNIDRKFVALLAEFKNNGWLKDPYETIRNGRRVVAVAVENKRKIRGIVHDESGTGNTLFIEPDETLHMNNELVELQLAEKREIYRILQTLTAKIRPHAEQIKRHQRLMAHLDFIRAKAMLAWDINAHMPRISEDKSVELFAACHPLLLLRNKAQGKKTIPLNLHFSLAERILVVSGPNAGGKSVLLKTVGLLQLMFQAGLLVPVADNSIMSVFSNFFVDIGDEQSIENDLSTYSSHLRNMRYFTEFANNKTLLLIDEFGAGTDPMLGGAIAEAILEHLIRKFCYGIITTHYANLKVFASKSNGVFNGSMAFDFRTLSPLYRLEIGRPGSSYAFELAQKSQLNTAIINTAKTKVDTNYKEFDELLNSLRAEKQQAVEREQAAAEKEARYEALLTEYNALFNDLDKRKKKILLETEQQALEQLTVTNRKFEQLMRELKENNAEKQTIRKIKTEIEQDKSRMNETIEYLKDDIYYRDSTAPVSVNCFARLRTGTEIGQVVELRKDLAVVEFGSLRTKIKARELIVVEAAPPKKQSGIRIENTLYARSEFNGNIDVRGMRRDEALELVESLIDKALLYNVHELKIIHGLGTGILRQSIREIARKYSAVKSISDEEPQYGGSGVSVIELG